jgi:hypothetical protein
MDEVHEFCRRVLGSGAAADAAASAVLARRHASRIELYAVAAQSCRAHAGEETAPSVPDGATLSDAVAAEVGRATLALPERQREVLALRESARLSHDQIASVLGLDNAAVAPLLARARLALREQRRGLAASPVVCAERDRALRALARRQDSEALTGDDDAWLHRHLAECVECDQAHAAMLEASVCYRAAGAPGPPADDAVAPQDAVPAQIE